MAWGIKYASTKLVQQHGEHAEDANIWIVMAGIDPPFTDETEAWKFCVEEDRDTNFSATHRPYKMEET